MVVATRARQPTKALAEVPTGTVGIQLSAYMSREVATPLPQLLEELLKSKSLLKLIKTQFYQLRLPKKDLVLRITLSLKTNKESYLMNKSNECLEKLNNSPNKIS